MTDLAPIAFFSYVHKDDEHENGLISRLREALQGEARMQLGREFTIFQDREHILWGQAWRKRIDAGLDSAALLVPIVTPSFFQSEECRREVHRFHELEQRSGRDDLILPIYYVSCTQLDDPVVRELDELGQLFAARQYVDWRELRFTSFESSELRKMLAALAARMVETSKQDNTGSGRAPLNKRRAEHSHSEGSEDDQPKVEHTEFGPAGNHDRSSTGLASGRSWNRARESRYATATIPLRRAYSSLSDTSWELLEGDSSQEQFRANLTESLRYFAEAFTLITGVTCRASVRIVAAPTQAGDLLVNTLAQSDTESIPHAPERINDNTDLKSILLDQNLYFFSNDLAAEFLRGYRNSHWDEQTLRTEGFAYRSIIVWPIERTRTMRGELREARELLGFVTVDSVEANVFNQTYDVPIGAAYSYTLHLALRLLIRHEFGSGSAEV